MNERIQLLINALGINKTKFADKLELSRPFVSEICSGTKSPSDRTISSICRIFDVNKEWLVNGTGNMFVEKTRAQEITEFVSRAIKSGDSFQARLIAALAQTSEEEWEMLESFARKVMESIKDEK